MWIRQKSQVGFEHYYKLHVAKDSEYEITDHCRSVTVLDAVDKLQKKILIKKYQLNGKMLNYFSPIVLITT